MPATGSDRRPSAAAAAAAGSMDSSRRLSTSSDCSLPDKDRQLLQENVENIPTRLPKVTASKPAANPLQFIKVGPCDLYRSAQEQIRKVEEVKKIKQKRDEAEDWQSNLDSWKNSRRKRQEHIIERVVEVKKFELEEFDRNRKRSKTFNEMIEERTNRGRKVSLVLYKDDNDRDLSDLGIGANNMSGNYGSDSNDEMDVIGNGDTRSSGRCSVSPEDGNISQDITNFKQPQEFTYEQAIQGYVNFAEARVRSNLSFKNEEQIQKATNCTSRSEERLPDCATKKEKTPPPVAPKPRKYSLKLEEKVHKAEKKNTFAEGSDNISDINRKLSLPQVDVLKRREVFEKSLASNEHSTKNKPNVLLDSKTVKERLTCLGINSSTVNGRSTVNEVESTISRNPESADGRKQKLRECTNIRENKPKQNGNNTSFQISYKNGPENLEKYGIENNLHTAKDSDKLVNSVTNTITDDEYEVIADKYPKNKESSRDDCSESSGLIARSKPVGESNECWRHAGSGKSEEANRWKLHRSLDSLDRNYTNDLGCELLERVQSLDGLDQSSSVKDYPLSASSVEMLGSSSNGGDTDREDSGIHTADVSCSISQTDEAGEYGETTMEINAFSNLLVDNNMQTSEVRNESILEGRDLPIFLSTAAKDTTGISIAASRISEATFTSSKGEQVSVSDMNVDVSFQTLGDVTDLEGIALDKSAKIDSSLNAVSDSGCTSVDDGNSCCQEPESESGSCTDVSNMYTVCAEDDVSSDVGREDSMHSCESSLAFSEVDGMPLDSQSEGVKTTLNASQCMHDALCEIKMDGTLSQPTQSVSCGESAELKIKCSEQPSPPVLKCVNFDRGGVCGCSDTEWTADDKPLSPICGNTHSPNPVPYLNLETNTVSAEVAAEKNSFKCNSCMREEMKLPYGITAETQSLETDVKSVELSNEHVFAETIRVKTEDFPNEHNVHAKSGSPDRNSSLYSNAANPETEILVVAESQIMEVNQEQIQEEDHNMVLVQKAESSCVDVENGGGNFTGALSVCSNKDSSSDVREYKEVVHDSAYTEEAAGASSSENQNSLTSDELKNGQVDDLIFNGRICVIPISGPSIAAHDHHSAQKNSDVVKYADMGFLTEDQITKDLRNNRVSESPTVETAVFLSPAVEAKESHVSDISPVFCQIPPLNLSSEVEIVAGLTFPLGPVTAAEPPKEKPPPPPPPSDLSDDEQTRKGSVLQRNDSTRRIKKEIRRKRTNFLGIEGNSEDYLETELQVAPPPDMTTFLMEEQRLQKQLYRQSICSESDSNLGETTDSRDSGVELEKGNPDDIWAPKPPSTPDVLSVNHSRQNSEIFGNMSITSEDDEIAKKEREIIEILEKEEQWRHGHGTHNREDSIGDELTEKLWQLEQDNMRFEWEKETKRIELEENEQRQEEEVRQKERELELQQHEAMLQMERTRLEREAEVIARQKGSLQQPQQWGNKGHLSLQDVSVIRHPVPKTSAQFPPRTMLPEHCRSLPDLQQKKQEHDWKQHSPVKSLSNNHAYTTQQNWREKANYNRSSWTPAFSSPGQQKDFPATGGSHIQGQQMTRQTLQALSAVPRSRLIPTDNWIRAKRKPESKRGTFNSQHWLIQEAEQRRITEQQQRNATASQKIPTSQLSQPLHWMQQQPQQKKPLPDSVINTLTQRVQNKVDNKKYTNRTRTQDNQSQDHFIGSNNIPRSSDPTTTTNGDQTEKMLSVSGKKKCSHCGEELGRGAAMIIESLRLFYHIDCFKCCVCHMQLGDGLMGTDVRVRNNKLHCHNCYSSEDGVKFSCV